MTTVRWQLAAVLLHWAAPSLAGWQTNLPPRRYFRLEADATLSFRSNYSGGDFFRILQITDGFIVVGARDAAYNLSLTDLRQVRKLSWPSNASTVELCSLKGKPMIQCQNYIRVFVKTDEGDLLVCGTNAFSPRCRRYKAMAHDYERESLQEEQDVGICPHSPIHNSTSTYVDGHLYVGTAADFSGEDALILRDRLRTNKWDTIALDDPHFVSSFPLGDHVYFFFREKAVEHINCGKRVFSRVARVCRRDTGGPNRFKYTWTSYMKTRLNCSVTGQFPFYFDEIQATSTVVESSYGGDDNRFIYGVFTTPANAIAGSAVCAFRLQRVLDAFAGPFKGLSSLNANWLPVPANKVPQPRPGQCVNDSKTLPNPTVSFIKKNPLMDEAVGAFFGGPILTRISRSYRFSAVAVDARVRTVGVTTEAHQLVDVIFIGTDNGRVIKLFNSDHTKSAPVVVEEIQAFPVSEAVRGLHVSRLLTPHLVANSDNQVIMIPLGRCYGDKVTLCSECVALQDPYCAWHQRLMRCKYVQPGSESSPELVQSVLDGVSPRCPQRPNGVSGLRPVATSQDEFDQDQPLTFRSEIGLGQHDWSQHGHPELPGAAGPGFSAETLAVAVASTAIAALLLGCAAGYGCGRRYRSDDINLPYADTDYTYLDQRQAAANARRNHEPGIGRDEVTYSEPVLVPTTNMMSTLKKSLPATSGRQLQYTDCTNGPVLSLRCDLYGGHRQLRSRTLPSANPGIAEEVPTRRTSPSEQETSIADGHHARSIRRVYL